MATTTNAADVLQALECHPLLPAQVTLDREGFGGTAQFLHITVLKILHPDVWVDTGLGKDGSGPRWANSVDVGEGDFNSLFAGNVDTSYPCH